ncbi:hypothetical protein K458DRAFT_440900 [Lentithecium fluviatile CBS 122367]|uniref:tRNA(Phe) (4-demethylwyosine(37)-C(7)) aminocarboxypropyltransferase n=1 Tax=Lentithecium fluviatile CBS 122367 TaxID=1168545 RepID=A0A6G1JDL9_9PLEO|nr:hypothetical protein K458DRAFT_440900 [Lentithecium fluviatile CBS 122367]
MGPKEKQNAQIFLLVTRSQVKRVKSALEARNALDRKTKISPEMSSEAGAMEPRMLIPTNLAFHTDPNLDTRVHDIVLKDLLSNYGLSDVQDEIKLSLSFPTPITTPPTRNRLLIGLKAGLEDLPPELLTSLDLSADTLLTNFPTTYTLYHPLLLLPQHALTSRPWTTLLSKHPPTSTPLQALFKKLATSVGATHVAINAAIPLQNPESENILRSPSNLTPLYGDFGPAPSTQTLNAPTPNDFERALWVTHTQNSIQQTWAPLYTMFSRGNIREKTRLLNLPSVLSCSTSVEFLGSADDGPLSTAIDLYAGIGYFAFPLHYAGIRKMLCWELNPWSVEGLRRGAALNGWTCQILPPIPPTLPPSSTSPEWTSWTQQLQPAEILVFPSVNTTALLPVTFLQSPTIPPSIRIPPVRHINCGFLPSSKLSWSIAVKLLDRSLGGWIHAHENVGVRDIQAREKEVVEMMRAYVDEWEVERGGRGGGRVVRCEHVERVKTYAPGVLHIVLDVWVGGVGSRKWDGEGEGEGEDIN